MEFPRLVFKDKGDQLRHGGTYSSLLVESEAEYRIALDNGWFGGLIEATNAVNKPAAGLVLPSDNAPPSREEMEAKAKELGIAFHPSIGDNNLLKKINDSLKG